MTFDKLKAAAAKSGAYLRPDLANKTLLEFFIYPLSLYPSK